MNAISTVPNLSESDDADDAIRPLPAAALRFDPGRNCARVARAGRIGVSVDGETYFAALRQTLIRARHCIAITAWDLHSGVELVRPGDDAAPADAPDDPLPTKLGDLLTALLEQRPNLQVFILLWDYAPIYALEREPLFFGDAPWGGGSEHPRLHFITDSAHPLAASQHQKLVVIDGRIAWCGGFDISKWRWDTSAHLADEPRRCDPDGDPYPPFHDIQCLVDREAAEAIGELFAERWESAGGDPRPLASALAAADPDREDDQDADPWPPSLEPLFRDHPLALARTLPSYKGRAEVREVEQLYLDMIAAAQRFIYIENQYLTSRSIADALCRALQRDDAPELVIVLPQETGHWLEQHTMDTLRARVLERLRDADRHDRLRVVYPQVDDLANGCLMVHAKLMIVDDRVLRIGSSNLSNRSMGLDSECDLCLIAEPAEDRAAITQLRRMLMAELGSGSVAVLERAERAAADAGRAGLIEALEALQQASPTGDGPRLEPLDGQVDPEWDRQLPDERLIDPDRALDSELITDAVVGKENTPALRRRLLLGGLLIGLLLALAAAWRWTPLGGWLHPETIASALHGLNASGWGLPVGVSAFAIASVLAVPVTLLILVAALIFGAATGAAVALAGSTLSALLGYGLGRATGSGLVEQLAGGRLERVRRRITRRGITTIITVRIVPVAPFAVLNLLAGAVHVSFRDFLIGTVVGMLPGIIAMTLFAEGLLSLLGRVDLRAVALLLVGGLSLGGLFLLGRRALGSDGE